jgi:hypothetical protein
MSPRSDNEDHDDYRDAEDERDAKVREGTAVKCSGLCMFIRQLRTSANTDQAPVLWPLS